MIRHCPRVLAPCPPPVRTPPLHDAIGDAVVTRRGEACGGCTAVAVNNLAFEFSEAGFSKGNECGGGLCDHRDAIARDRGTGVGWRDAGVEYDIRRVGEGKWRRRRGGRSAFSCVAFAEYIGELRITSAVAAPA